MNSQYMLLFSASEPSSLKVVRMIKADFDDNTIVEKINDVLIQDKLINDDNNELVIHIGGV